MKWFQQTMATVVTHATSTLHIRKRAKKVTTHNESQNTKALKSNEMEATDRSNKSKSNEETYKVAWRWKSEKIQRNGFATRTQYHNLKLSNNKWRYYHAMRTSKQTDYNLSSLFLIEGNEYLVLTKLKWVQWLLIQSMKTQGHKT